MEIEKLAKLAKISLSSEEKKKLQKEFDDILNYVSALKEADTESLKPEENFYQAGTLNAMRADENAHKTGEFTKELIEEAPAYPAYRTGRRTGRPLVENGYVKVKHVFE